LPRVTKRTVCPTGCRITHAVGGAGFRLEKLCQLHYDVHSMDYEHIVTQQQLVEFCDRFRGEPTIAFDTEFISEDSYKPELCLIQVAVHDKLAVIDPLAVTDVNPFWELLAAPGHETIVHSGRQEFQFCNDAIGRRPQGWFDVQVAAGFVGTEYPAAYASLIAKLLNQRLPKGETRTNWRKRPLSQRQLEYALHDVLYLQPIRDLLVQNLDRLGRRTWLSQELAVWQDSLEKVEQQERWRRVSGISGLSSRSLAIVREVWRWRDGEARRRNSPAKRVLRDDLIVELARRKSADARQIYAVRGMERGNLKRHLDSLAESVERALALPDTDCPRLARANNNNASQYNLPGQFLNTALGCICRSAKLAPTLVGTVQDVRDLIAYRLHQTADQQPPALTQGWRAEVVGHLLDDLLAGKSSLRIADPAAEQPLEIVES